MRITIPLLTLILLTQLTACSVFSDGAIIGANKAYNNADYKEAIRKSDRALREYKNSYSFEQQAKLKLLKADSLSALGEHAKAQVVYRYIINNYPQTESQALAKSQLNSQGNNEIVTHYQYITTIETPVHIAKTACNDNAKKEASEYFGLHLSSKSTITENADSQQNNEQQLTTSHIQLHNTIKTHTAETLQVTKLQETVSHENKKLIVRCKIRSVNLSL